MSRTSACRKFGLARCSAPHAVHPISDLQIEYSLISRGLEGKIPSTARELGFSVTAYGVLSRGLISGHWSQARAGEHDFRSINPRFQGENLEHNLALVEKLRALAAEKDASNVQIAIAWAMAQGEDIVPLVGARKPGRLAEALGALRVNQIRPRCNRGHRSSGRCCR
jgi:aryl-alcohol dehydrogenase-like predicted oxidoreductase